jgi:HD-like signal output (HDOD) protein
MKQIIFVDDEPNVLAGLRRMLRPLRHEWSMDFVEDPLQALTRLASHHYDVIVSDIRMPGLDGVELLKMVKARYPNAIRIALSGHADMEMCLESARAAHQYLSKPCDSDSLKSTIDRAFSLQDLLTNERLVSLVSGLDSLPSLPHLYTEILDELGSSNGTMKRVGEIISKDVAMTAKVLQMVNSAFFGLPRHVSTPVQAAALLGMDVIRSLVLSAKIFSAFEGRQVKSRHIEQLWNHSSKTASLAKAIASAHGQDRKCCDFALMAGMLQDIGILIIAADLPDEAARIYSWENNERTAHWKAEQEILSCSHMEIGAYLLGLWGLPNPIVEAVAYHHQPSRSVNNTFTPLTAVHIADALVAEGSSGATCKENLQLDVKYLIRLGLTDHLESWRQVYDEVLGAEENENE